jgi:hypothetical protein
MSLGVLFEVRRRKQESEMKVEFFYIFHVQQCNFLPFP